MKRMNWADVGDLDEIRAFVQTASSGSQTAASRVLGVSPSVVSRRLERLEARLGVRLMERTTRRSALTSEGRRALVHMHRIMASLEALLDDLQQTDRVRGDLRVVVPTLLVPRLMRRLPDLLDDHPELNLHLSATDRPVDLVAEGVDVQVTPHGPTGADLIHKRLGEMHGRLCAAPSYFREGRKRPSAPCDLAVHRCLRFRGVGELQRTWPLLDEAGALHEAEVGGSFFSDSSAILQRALFAGVGIGVQPSRELEAHLETGALVPVLPGYRFEFPLVAVYPRSKRRTRRVQLMLEVLSEVAGELSGVPAINPPRPTR